MECIFCADKEQKCTGTVKSEDIEMKTQNKKLIKIINPKIDLKFI